LNAAERAEQQMQEKKKKELLQRLQEEKARKSGRPEMVPGEGVPGEHAHERKPGEGYDVSVRGHRRRKPRKEKVNQDDGHH